MRDLRGLRRTVIAAALAGLVLSGCSEKQEASDTLPTTAAETTESLPPVGPADFPVPDEARTKDAAGAEAFTRYYMDLINRSSRTLDATPLRDLSEGCDDCDRIAANAESSAQAGYRYEGGVISVTEVAQPLVTGETAEMAIRIDQTALAVLDRSGSPVEEGSSDAFRGIPANVALKWAPALKSWRMTYLAFG
ncbi:hypothetical protein DQ244_16330 [Blastococcus sp. TBT05-19]|uniref:DUF6318 family protein n=1 Tax=Blastococcus sp. TBT05-19 TaxID=2250581 RepID=UPI000DE83ABB|nr:DUF6318 family protein [Blastococcus sp. TBT05-19]RBY88118.1 hypothetical protein DQ244_16330 [Blastococcus sp. TBT05-19]